MTYRITSDRGPQGGPPGHPQIGDGRGLRRRRDDGHRDTELDGRDENRRFVVMRSMLVSVMPIVVPVCSEVSLSAGGRNRTCNRRFRKSLLCPLSYARMNES